MRYEELVGQERIIEYLKDAVGNDHFPHALLFHGSNGYGTLSLALAAATHLLCQQPEPEGPCGKCHACHQMSRLIHPDCHLSFPVVKKSGKTRKDTTSVDFMPEWRNTVLDNPYVSLNAWLLKISTNSAKGDINVTECTRIIRELNLKAFSGIKKVQIIWMAELLGNNGNKLLKIIEEPPENTHIMLVVEDMDRVLGTIQSRCQIVRVTRIEESVLTNFLSQKHGISSERARQIVQLSEGDLEMALDYFQLAHEEILPVALKWMDLCKKNDVIGIRDWVEHFNGFNLEEQKLTLKALLRLLRENVNLLYQKNHSESVPLSDQKFLEKRPYLAQLDLQQSSDLMEIIQEGMYLLERNVHGKILLFNTSLRIHRVFAHRYSTVDEL